MSASSSLRADGAHAHDAPAPSARPARRAELRTDRLVREHLTSAVTEFFASCGAICAPTTDDEPSAGDATELGAIIGFRGKTTRGGLAFVAPADLIVSLLPVPTDALRPDIQLRDWAAEIANQLVGRFKNKLGAAAGRFDVGSAVCFTGTSIRLVFLPNTEGLSVTFRVAGRTVRLHLDCTSNGAGDAAHPWALPGDAGPPGDFRIVAEGNVILF